MPESGPAEPADAAPGSSYLLVVEDDDDVMRALVRALSPPFIIEPAATVERALAILAGEEDLSGAILDIRLPDGSGLHILERLRAQGHAFPVLVLSGYFERDDARAAQLYGAEFLPKPHAAEHLAAFTKRIEAHRRSAEQRATAVLEKFAQSYGLTHREKEIVAFALEDLSRVEMLKRMGITRHTLKSHVRGLLKKSRERTLSMLARRIRRAIRGEEPKSGHASHPDHRR